MPTNRFVGSERNGIVKADMIYATRDDRRAPAVQTKVSLPRVEPVTLRDKIITILKDAFFSRRLRPGDLIVESQLARQMKAGSTAIREALVTLQEQGFVQRIVNRGTYVIQFDTKEVEQLFHLRTELEVLGLRWAKARVTEADLVHLEDIINGIVDAVEERNARLFFERDLEFHRQCWTLSGNKFLSLSLERIVPPLFAFVLTDNQTTVNELVARKHLDFVYALRNLQEPEFSATIRNCLTDFAHRALSSVSREP